MTLDNKMFEIMGDLKFPCEYHGMTHRGVRGILRTVHRLAEKGRLSELNKIYEDMNCSKLKAYIWDVYHDGVKKKAHRLVKNGEIEKLDALYKAQDCEELHKYIENLHESEKKWHMKLDYDYY